MVEQKKDTKLHDTMHCFVLLLLCDRSFGNFNYCCKCLPWTIITGISTIRFWWQWQW